MDGDVTVRVTHSTVNYKDGLAVTGKSPVVRRFPMIPGIDFAGVVEASTNPAWKPGDEVILNGWGLGETHLGGYAQKARVKGDWLVPLPKGLTRAQAMAIGTAGYTAMLSVLALELHGLTPAMGPAIVTGAAGGVGSIAIQLAKCLAGVRVVATASRPESRAQALALGADLVIDHSQPTTLSISQQLADAGIRWVDWIFSISHTDAHFAELAKSIAPFGRLCVIDETGPIDVRLLKARSASLHWEGMFTRSGFNLPDMGAQGALLNQVADLVDAGRIRSTHSQTAGHINAADLRAAHAAVETGRTVGKIVLAGF